MELTVLYITPFLSLKDCVARAFQRVQFPFQQRACVAKLKHNIFQRKYLTGNH